MRDQFRAVGWLFIVISILGLIGGIAYSVVMPNVMSRWMDVVMSMPNTTYAPGHSVSQTPSAGNLSNKKPHTVPSVVQSPPVPNPAAPPPEMKAMFENMWKSMVPLSIAFCILWNGAAMLAGWAILDRRPWGRVMAIVMSILMLPQCPGLAAGIYGLIVMLKGNAAEEWQAYVTQS